MALVRCPQCGRVAEPPSCFACGHTWTDDGGASAAPAFDESPKDVSQPPPSVDFGLDDPPVVQGQLAPEVVDDPMAEAGDLFGFSAPPTPPPAQAPAADPAFDVDMDFGAQPPPPPPSTDAGIDFGALGGAPPPPPPPDDGGIDFGALGGGQPMTPTEPPPHQTPTHV